MYLADLQSKDVVSITDGRNLGRIVDMEITTDGRVVNIVVERKSVFKKFFSSSSQLNLTFSDIEKIGDDVILIKI